MITLYCAQSGYTEVNRMRNVLFMRHVSRYKISGRNPALPETGEAERGRDRELRIKGIIQENPFVQMAQEGGNRAQLSQEAPKVDEH